MHALESHCLLPECRRYAAIGPALSPTASRLSIVRRVHERRRAEGNVL
jgi:hypothetical protein